MANLHNVIRYTPGPIPRRGQSSASSSSPSSNEAAYPAAATRSTTPIIIITPPPMENKPPSPPVEDQPIDTSLLHINSAAVSTYLETMVRNAEHLEFVCRQDKLEKERALQELEATKGADKTELSDARWDLAGSDYRHTKSRQDLFEAKRRLDESREKWW